jgi:hypothetical protein
MALADPPILHVGIGNPSDYSDVRGYGSRSGAFT